VVVPVKAVGDSLTKSFRLVPLELLRYQPGHKVCIDQVQPVLRVCCQCVPKAVQRHMYICWVFVLEAVNSCNCRWAAFAAAAAAETFANLVVCHR
jgi:hypothetical protein